MGKLVSIEGNHALSSDDVLGKIATSPSPKFLWVKSGVMYPYELYDRFSFQRDLARVERFYRARGYYEAQARAGRVELVDKDKVAVTVVVEEGVPVRIRSATVRTGISTIGTPLSPIPQACFCRRAATISISLTGLPVPPPRPFPRWDRGISSAVTRPTI